MNVELSDVECRVLGCLIEKENTTPDYYPMTLNALTNACNQKTNRDPVVDYDEETVERGLDSLREKNLVYVLYSSGSRTAKYKHLAPSYFEIEQPATAVLCVLLLRGPQTLGELNQRTARIHDFADLNEVNETVEEMVRRDRPLVVRLPKQPGQKDGRCAHLLSGEIDLEDLPVMTPTPARAKDERIANLEEKVGTLENELKEFRQAFEEFRQQFE